MVIINAKIINSIPDLCPECKKRNMESKLRHVNALDTKAKIYMVYCPNPTCRYVKDWKRSEL